MTPADISVVIPALREEHVISDSVRSAFDAGSSEVIVVDGGRDDRTSHRAVEAGATKLIRSFPGRGIQMNAGAGFATGEIVLFLHADNRLGPDCLHQICEQSDVVWGAFRQRIANKRRIYRLLEAGNARRVQWRNMPFGDQSIFVRRSIFREYGGFDEVPLMEDVALAKELRKIAKPILLPGPVTIDARRWEKHGVIRQTLRNWTLQTAYAVGFSPERLSGWYLR